MKTLRQAQGRLLRTLYHLVRADFLERIRRSSFLITLALTVWAGYLFVPPEGAGYLVLFIGQKRSIYNSSWIGLMFGFIAASHLALLGFYLVKNAVGRDRDTGVGQIIATTPVRKPTYVVGKWVSNVAVLVTILSVITVMAVVMQLVRAEDAAVDLSALAAPIWLMGLPVLAIAAAVAVLFESISFLRGGYGNVAYFFLWTVALASVLATGIDEATDLARPFSDLFGYTRQLADIQQQVLAADPDANVSSGLLTRVRGREVGTFVWDGFDWTAGIVRERVLWSGLAMVVALASAIPFDRFDTPWSKGGSPRSKGLEVDTGGMLWHLRRRIWSLRGDVSLAAPSLATDATPGKVGARLQPLAAGPRRGRFSAMLAAELKLMLKGRTPIWYAGAVGLIAACLVCPLDAVRQYLLPAIWLWPVLVWSQMGIRERRHNTEQVVFSAPRPVWGQLPPTWLAGVIMTVVLGSGAGIRLAATGNLSGLSGWLAGGLFVPSLALALGVWVGNSRAFEVLYSLLWYVGVVNRVPVFDYAGVTVEGLAMGVPVVYLGITVGLVVLAVLGRRRQVQG